MERPRSRMFRHAAAAWLALGLLLAGPRGESAARAASDLPRLFEALGMATYAPATRPPGFEGVTAEGERVSLAGLRGRVVLLNFWASWCPECMAELPGLQRLHVAFAAEGLTLLGVNARESPATVRGVAAELGLTFATVVDPTGRIQADYGVVGLPTSFLVGRDGQALGRVIGPREWGGDPARALLRVLLAQPGGGPEAR